MALANLIITSIAALAAVTAVFVSIWLARQDQKQRSQPEISVFLDYSVTHHRFSSQPGPYDVSYSTHLCVKNTGIGAARHIRFEGDFSFRPVYGKPLVDCDSLDTCEFLIDGIDQLLPGDTQSYTVFSVTGPAIAIFNRDAYQNRDSKVTLDVSYKNVKGHTYKNEGITLDFAKSVDMSSYSTTR